MSTAFQITRGDTSPITVPLTFQGAPYAPPEGTNLTLTIKRSASALSDPDTKAVVQKTIGAGLTLTGSDVSFTILSTEAARLDLRTFYLGVRAQEPDGTSKTVAFGTISVDGDVARQIDTSIPIYTTEPGAYQSAVESAEQAAASEAAALAYRNEAEAFKNTAGASAATATTQAGLATTAKTAAEQAVIDAGDASRLTIGAVATGAPGSAAAASITGSPGAQALNLTIPAGAASVAPSDTPPASPASTLLWVDTATGVVSYWNAPSGQWVSPFGGVSPPAFYPSDTPPVDPASTLLWIDTSTGVVSYWNESSDQWVSPFGGVSLDGAGGGGATNLSFTRDATSVTVASDTGTDAALPAATTSLAGVLTAADKSKLDGIASGATANSTDAHLLNRANHTGTQSAATITGLATVATSGAYSDLTGRPTLATVATSGSYNDLTSRPTLGTAAALNAGSAGGVATLDGSGKLTGAQVPAIAITDTFAVASQAAMLALAAEQGDVAIRTDINKSFILSSSSPSTLADWKELLTPTDLVQSVAGRSGNVVLTAADIGSGTFDLARLPVASSGASSATQVVRADDSRLSDDRTPTAHMQAWSTITATPTTLSGYGITDAAAATHTHTASDVSDFASSARAQIEGALVAGSNITLTPSGSGATRQITIASTGGGGATNLSFTRDASTVTVASDTGTDAVLPAATTSLAGVFTAAQAVALDNSQDNLVLAAAAMGSTMFAETVGVRMPMAGTAQTLTDNTIRFSAVYVARPRATCTGVSFFRRTSGVFVADQTNALALYSYNSSNGELTKIAETANDSTIWSGAANVFANIPWTTPVSNLAAGLYFVGALYNNSSQTTAPQIAGAANLGNTAQAQLPGATNSARLYASRATMNDLGTTHLSSALSNSLNPLWFGLY